MTSSLLPSAAMALLTAALPSLAAGQSATAPIDHSPVQGVPVEGASFTSGLPFSSGISRVQYIYATAEDGVTLLNIPNGRQITALRFPADMSAIGSPISLQIEVLMASTTAVPDGMSNTFANNYSTPPTVVFPRGVFRLPDLSVATEVMLPLATPFTFDASQNLLVEFRISANSNSNRSFDYRLDLARARPESGTTGQGCAGSNGNPLRLTSSAPVAGQRWNLTLRDGPGSSTAALHFGARPFPSPIAIPGAPGCTIDMAPFAADSKTTASNGSASWSVSTPDQISLWNITLQTQAYALDLFANNLGVVTSNVAWATFGLEPRIARLVSTGSTTAMTGSRDLSFGQITRFDHN